MTLLKVIIIRHHIHRFIRISLVLKIKPNTGQTLGTRDKRERRKIRLSLRGPILNVILIFFSKSEKVHNGGQTWHIFCVIQRRGRLHYPTSLSVKLNMFIFVLRKLKLIIYTGTPLNNPPIVSFQGG